MGDACQLDKHEVARYSRQLIMPEIGVKGQTKLKNAKVLIIGAGGLGCPAAQYLACAGVGTIGIVDYDEVEVSNLHRQILHTEKRAAENWSKSESASKALTDLNSRLKVIPIMVQLDRTNAAEIFCEYDVVIDATDNVTSRYLISDMCVLLNKPLVSGSALRWEGQLTIYHHTDHTGDVGPCYRCLYPNPPPPDTVTNCSDGGVIGVVPGIIGCMQSLEAIKLIIGVEPAFHKKLYLFDGLRGASRTIALRARQPSCVCCGDKPTITLQELPDYVEFCGMSANDKCRMLSILEPKDRISVKEFSEIRNASASYVLVDVRSPVELDICSLPGCINIPIQHLEAMAAHCCRPTKATRTFPQVEALRALILQKTEAWRGRPIDESAPRQDQFPIYVLCRMGNDSQKAVKILRDHLNCGTAVAFKDIKGGLMAWAAQIDHSMMQY